MVDDQVTREGELLVDGVATPFIVRADYLVERNGIRAVVEVKTGAVASPSSRATRRQVLEYAWIFGVTDVYLFDADREALHRISVPAPSALVSAPRRTWVLGTLIAGALIGAIAVYLFT